MTGYTVHTGSSEDFTHGWDRIFIDKGGKKKTASKKKATKAKPSTKRKASGKRKKT